MAKKNLSNLIPSFLVLFLLLTGLFFKTHGLSLLNLPLFTQTVRLSGTGSMYPTIPKGTAPTLQEQAKETVGTMSMYTFTATPSAFQKLFKTSTLNYGDIVSFDNATTRQITAKQSIPSSGFIKRLIALPGDTIELRDGLVYRNQELIEEPYVATPHSTFGGEFLPDCKKLTIPSGKIFVMGDNRKGSNDSREEVGLVDINDIDSVLPLYKQIGTWDSHWHDPKKDASDSSRIKLDVDQYVKKLNQYRQINHKPALKYDPRLEKSAALRLASMLRSNDLSYAATRSGLTQAQALSQAGYSNRTWGEHVRLGYYTAEEMFESDLQYTKLIDFLSNSDFQDIGIAVATGSLNGCPTQLIVRHFGGYVPPNYTSEEISQWDQRLKNETQIAQTWKFSSSDPRVTQINQLFDRRLELLRQIAGYYHKNQWVPDQLYTQASQLADQLNHLADELNNQ